MYPEIEAVKMLMKDYQRTWAICGGWAIDLFLGKQNRPHKDIDLFIWRDEQLYAQEYFKEHQWLLQIAHVGNPNLMDWDNGDYLNLPYHTIWCKHESYKPDFVELLFNERDEENFLFRRDKSIRLPLEKVLRRFGDVPYLSPEIALLYKAAHPELAENQADFDNAKAKLSEVQRLWLFENIAKRHGDDHLWLKNEGE